MAEEKQQHNAQTALIALAQRGQADEEAYRASLTPAEREQIGEADHWAPKEIIAHFAYWKTRQAERLAGLESLAGTAMLPDAPPWEQINEETWPEHARLSWDEAVARSDKATSELIAALRRLPPERFADLQTPESPGDRIIATTIGNSYAHIIQHLSDSYLAQGEHARATQVQRELVQAIQESGLGEAQELFARYNLACFYAVHGQQAEALAELRNALPKRSDLLAYAQDDHDLDSLRSNPEFTALLAAKE